MKRNSVQFRCALRNRPQPKHNEPPMWVGVLLSALVGAAVAALFIVYLPQ